MRTPLPAPSRKRSQGVSGSETGVSVLALLPCSSRKADGPGQFLDLCLSLSKQHGSIGSTSAEGSCVQAGGDTHLVGGLAEMAPNCGD